MRLKVLLGTFLILHSTSAVLEPISGLSSEALAIFEELRDEIKDLKAKVAIQDDEIKDLKTVVLTLVEKVLNMTSKVYIYNLQYLISFLFHSRIMVILKTISKKDLKRLKKSPRSKSYEAVRSLLVMA